MPNDGVLPSTFSALLLCIPSLLAAHVKRIRGDNGTSLVVAPLSVMQSWIVEFNRWAPSLQVIKLHSVDATERERREFSRLCILDLCDACCM